MITTMITTMTSREFNQDRAGAKQAAARGPVIITDRGRPAHVLMTYERFQALSGSATSIVDLLSMPEAGDIAFEPPRAAQIYRDADLG
jgi:PHD/YefM family antitoxin component YafN of YafNO toxin-antitoxin module